MPVIKTKGAASSQGFGEFAKASASTNYIEDVFSTYVYTGAGGTAATISNGINLSGKGGLVWSKKRGQIGSHVLLDTVRGDSYFVQSDTTNAQQTYGAPSITYGSSGYTTSLGAPINENTQTYVSWTFREQSKFFDVVTYTGTGANTTIAHSLGSVPGCIIVKRTDTTGAWQVYHSSLANTEYLVLNTTAAKATGATRWNSTTPTSSVFSIGTDATVNASGGTYVAYIFASNAGGFGLTGTDNVITCGTFTTDASANATVNLGYEPAWVLVKSSSSSANNWNIQDNIRGFTASPTTSLNNPILLANTADAENNAGTDTLQLNATGFTTDNVSYNASRTYIYIAIRRGPMKTPTTGTSVFGLSARTGTGANATVTGGQTDDAVLVKNRGSAVGDLFAARLTGTGYLETSSTAAEVAAGTTILQANPWDVMDGVKVGTTSTITNDSASTFINYLFKRTPSFFDVVCYTGTSALQTQNHNLGVAPELIIIKKRTGDSTTNWYVYSANVGNTQVGILSATNAFFTNSGYWNNTSPTSSVFTLNTASNVNGSGQTFVAYLFATCAGVSKVGTYTGNGSTQTINCGFTGGARFVIIKRTDSTGDWYVYDTARGMTTVTDPYLLLNSTAAEAATLGSVTTVTTGFAVNASILAAINTSAATYIFLAIA